LSYYFSYYGNAKSQLRIVLCLQTSTILSYLIEEIRKSKGFDSVSGEIVEGVGKFAFASVFDTLYGTLCTAALPKYLSFLALLR
jgi:hypothetical protein